MKDYSMDRFIHDDKVGYASAQHKLKLTKSLSDKASLFSAQGTAIGVAFDIINPRKQKIIIYTESMSMIIALKNKTKS